MNDITLATEMLQELKASAKRWFVAFVIMVLLEIATVIGFLAYTYYTTPVEEDTVTVENEDGNANYIGNDMNGDITNGEDNSTESP